MTRDDYKFYIHYSYVLEKMNYTLLTRIDKLITLMLIVLGFSVFAPYSNLFIFGLFVAVLSVFIRACIFAGVPTKYDLTTKEKFIAWCAGDLPLENELTDINDDQQA